MVSLNRCNGSCNTVDDPSGRNYVPKTTKDKNLNVFSIITKIYKSKKLANYIPCDCKCKCDGKECNGNQKWNNDK